MHEKLATRQNLPRLQPFQTVAEYAGIGISLWNAQDSALLDVEQVDEQFQFRRQFRRDFGYVVASAEVMMVLTALLRNSGPVLDAGCGSGYLAKELARLGVPTFAVDHCNFRETRPDGQGYPINTVYQLDALGDAASFISSRFGAVLLAWPPYDTPFALKVALAMLPGQLLVYEGEDIGGCTADTEFFELLSDLTRWEHMATASSCLNAVHITLDTLHDRWKVWRRLG